MAIVIDMLAVWQDHSIRRKWPDKIATSLCVPAPLRETFKLHIR
jgi:hypothetical protein